MKVELSIKTTYLPGWGVWEGVRELVQNGKDAEVEFSSPLKVSFSKGVLKLENADVTLPYEALLMGHTTKLDKSDLIGQFGEGLKLGLLALVRAGRSVKIRSGGEVWVPTIEKSSKFDAEVLCIDIKGGRKNIKRVSVEIELEEAEWEDYSKRFIFLDNVDTTNTVNTGRGSLLLAPELKGSLYVKGIFVEKDPKLSFGYDYTDAAVDRDRKMVRNWDKQWETARIWQTAISTHPDVLFEHFFTMLRDSAPDLAGFDDYAASGITEKAQQMIMDRFIEVHGDKAVPVENMEQSMQLEHLGRKGVVTPKGLRLIIQQRQGTLDSVKGSLEKEVLKTYSWHDLPEEEKATLLQCLELVDHAVRKVLKIEASVASILEVVDFRSESLFGQFKSGKVLIAKRILPDRDETLATLLHELAHFAGQDGAHSHIAFLEKLWKGVVGPLLDEKARVNAEKD